MSMDPSVGNFSQADVLIEGKKILEVRPNISASGVVHVFVNGVQLLKDREHTGARAGRVVRRQR